MAIFAVLFIVAVLVSVITTPLGYIPFLGRLIQRVLEFVVAKAMLLVLGACWISFQCRSKQANRDRVKLKVGTSPGAGDIIVCNWTSYADVMYLASAYSPVFVFVDEVDSETKVASRGFVGALLASFTHTRPECNETLADVVNSARGRGQPVAIFAEGVRTNGIAVLSMVPFLRGFKDFKGSCFLLAFKHRDYVGCMPFTAGSVLLHAFHVMRQAYVPMTVRYLDSRCVPSIEDANKDPEKYALSCRDILANQGQLKTVKSKAEDKVDFMTFFTTGVKERKTRVGQGGRTVSEAGKSKAQMVDHAVLRTQRLAAKKKAAEDADKAGWDSDQDDQKDSDEE